MLLPAAWRGMPPRLRAAAQIVCVSPPRLRAARLRAARRVGTPATRLLLLLLLLLLLTAASMATSCSTTCGGQAEERRLKNCGTALCANKRDGMLTDRGTFMLLLLLLVLVLVLLSPLLGSRSGRVHVLHAAQRGARGAELAPLGFQS